MFKYKEDRGKVHSSWFIMVHSVGFQHCSLFTILFTVHCSMMTLLVPYHDCNESRMREVSDGDAGIARYSL